MITWFLNGNQVLPQGHGILVYERSSQTGSYNVSSSELMITTVQQKHNGQVQCHARSSYAGIDLREDHQTAQLVVLGKLTLCEFSLTQA